MLYPGRTLIFTNSIDCIKRLHSVLAILKRNPLPLHAQMEQKQRLSNLEKFSRKQIDSQRTKERVRALV
jgi:ATP-dependent RNA helicase DDX24/MAK5